MHIDHRCFYPHFFTISGVTLIEILITLLIISVGLIALLAMTTHSLKATRYAFYSGVALQQAKSLAEYQVYLKHSTHLLTTWNQDNQRLLPQGHGDLHSENGSDVITVNWYDNNQQYGVKLWIRSA